MKIKLLRRLRREFYSNLCADKISPWSGYLETTIEGREYRSDRLSTLCIGLGLKEKEFMYNAITEHVRSKRLKL